MFHGSVARGFDIQTDINIYSYRDFIKQLLNLGGSDINISTKNSK